MGLDVCVRDLPHGSALDWMRESQKHVSFYRERLLSDWPMDFLPFVEGCCNGVVRETSIMLVSKTR